MKFTRPVAFLCCALLSGCATWGEDSPFEDDGRYEHLKTEKRKKQEAKDDWNEFVGDAILVGALVAVVGGLAAYQGAKENRVDRRAKKRKKNKQPSVVTTQKVEKPDVWKKYPGLDQMKTENPEFKKP